MGQSIAVAVRKPQIADAGRPVQNAAPRRYRARFIEPGIISYNDQGDGVVFVSKEALDRMAPSFVGKPVIFVPEHHNDADAENSFAVENGEPVKAQGAVVDQPEWGDDGWQYVNMLVWDPEAQKAIDNGYSVSCAYWMDDSGPGGSWHNIPYDEEMKNGHYLHMAIVPNPRYEGSQIKANSKGGHTVAIKLFQRKNSVRRNADDQMVQVEGDKKPDDKDTEVVNAAPDSVVSLPGGGTATLQELIEAYKSASPEQGGPETDLDPDDQVDIGDGRVVTVSELLDAYQAKGRAQGDETDQMDNAEEPTDETAEPVVDEEAQGEGVRTNSRGRKRVNSAVRSAANRPPADGLGVDRPETRTDRLERGKSRYSRSVTQEAK